MVELLVVVGLTSVLMAIMLPAAGKVRQRAKALLCMQNQREIVRGVNLFGADNDGRYPESVATIGFGGQWHWEEPTMLTAYMKRSRGLRRSISAYLHPYIEDASIMVCPNAPREYKYLQEAWDAGDDWDHPETGPLQDPVKGTYCFYWNYTGILEERERLFKGPSGMASCGSGRSQLLVSDYFGYDHWRSPNAYGSSERFEGASVAQGSIISSPYWSLLKHSDDVNRDTLKIKLHAGYMDGHVERYWPSEVEPMKISITSDGSMPYPIPGIFYLPINAIY